MEPIPIEEKVQQTIRKNTTPSYGLTLVIGLPFPAEISHRIQHIQQQIEALAPGQFTWYNSDHLHATLMTLLRGRYREGPMLQRAELPTNLQNFARNLCDFFTQCQPFPLELTGVQITVEGLVSIGENTLARQLATKLHRYPELDPPKHLNGLQVTIGFFNISQPFANPKEQSRFTTALAQLSDIPVGKMVVRQVWLVHYANRTLAKIIGKVPFILSQVNNLTVEQLLRGLGITAT